MNQTNRRMKAHSFTHTPEKAPRRLLLSGVAAPALAVQLVQGLQGGGDIDIDPDVLWLKDDGTSIKVGKAEDTNPPKETVRGMIQWGHRSPRVGAWRVVLIENIERLTLVASNAMLKLIEEPPERTRFVMTTKNHHQLLTTIISRVTVVPVGGLPAEVPTSATEFWNLKKARERFVWAEAFCKKNDRNAVLEMLEGLFTVARKAAPRALPLLWRAYADVKGNGHQRFTLEHLSLELAAIPR